jgi:alkanesulfonate monooxygenase SsuD/methylene tetrahydromethanopterin reductase-like flavin-dependent oxidoreductase (luciferase family)
MMITDFCICAPTLDEAEQLARQHMGKFVESNFHHYELLGEHFATVKGYDAYAQKAEIARKGGLAAAVEGFMKAAVWGTPDRVLRELEARRLLIGDFELNASFRFGGIPYQKAEASLSLFAKEVLPVLKTWRPDTVANAAQ